MPRCADLILANRSYVDHDVPPGAPGGMTLPQGGGLIAALRSVVAPWDGGSGTTWIGAGRGVFDRAWVGPGDVEVIETRRGPLRHRRVFVDPATWQDHYVDAANGFLWPLLHLVRLPLMDVTSYYPAPRTPTRPAWASFQGVNRAFAHAAMTEQRRDTCWVHDYQLGLVPLLLREAGFPGRVGFFLHTPFPDIDLIEPLLSPEASECLREWLRGCLGADLVGVQTEADAERLIAAAVTCCGAQRVRGGIALRGRYVRVDAHPVGIDAAEVHDLACTVTLPAAAAAMRREGVPFVVGLERADFTKGIPERLAAISTLYRAGERFDYLGVAAPTRPGVTGYERLTSVIGDLAREASAAAAPAGARFVQVQDAMAWPDVVAIERDADVIFTSSLADGMNLVPLQAAVAQSVRPQGVRAVIIAGRDSGFAQVYGGEDPTAFASVDPLDPAAMTAVLREALHGRPARVTDGLVAAVRTRDAVAWSRGFIEELEGVLC